MVQHSGEDQHISATSQRINMKSGEDIHGPWKINVNDSDFSSSLTTIEVVQQFSS